MKMKIYIKLNNKHLTLRKLLLNKKMRKFKLNQFSHRKVLSMI